MPNYDYKCDHCEERFERIVTLDERDVQGCPGCGSEDDVIRQFSPPQAAPQFKGSGFHCNDYPSAKTLHDRERNSLVAYTPEDQHHMRRRGIDPLKVSRDLPNTNKDAWE